MPSGPEQLYVLVSKDVVGWLYIFRFSVGFVWPLKKGYRLHKTLFKNYSIL